MITSHTITHIPQPSKGGLMYIAPAPPKGSECPPLPLEVEAEKDRIEVLEAAMDQEEWSWMQVGSSQLSDAKAKPMSPNDGKST